MSRGSWVVRFVLILCLSAFNLSLGPSPAQAVTLQVNGSGILTGATGVDVSGTLYDVEFVDGTCVALFSGCDDASTDFTFQSASSAQAASQALVTHVLLDTSLGNFDSSPGLTIGCASLNNFSCLIVTPYTLRLNPQFTTNTEALVYFAFNSPPPSVDGVTGPGAVATMSDLTSTSFGTWAVWTPATAVPEPATLTLLILALAALGLWDYRRRQGRRTGTPHP